MKLVESEDVKPVDNRGQLYQTFFCGNFAKVLVIFYSCNFQMEQICLPVDV